MSRDFEKHKKKGGTSSSSSSSSSRSRSSSSSSTSSSDSGSPNRRHYKRKQYELQRYRQNQYDEFDLEPKKPYSLGRDIQKKKAGHVDSTDEEIDGYPIEDQPLEKSPIISNWSDKSRVSTTNSEESKKDKYGQPLMTLAEDKIAQPPAVSPPAISRTSLQFSKSGVTTKTGIQMKLPTTKPTQAPTKKMNVASAFNNESDDEVEEMPAECKMRMRNIGRDTPTSSGPNSFGKTKQGFVDTKKVFERTLRQAYAD